MIEITGLILFLQFGLMLNVITMILFMTGQSISAFSMGLMKSYELSVLGNKTFSEYKELKKKYETISYYIETFALFIPFFLTWRTFILLISWRANVLFFELPIINTIERIEVLKSKYKGTK
jgi:hypothetical protein